MRPSVKALLLNLDNGTVKTFTDGKTTGTYLDEMMATIKSTYPAHKNAPNAEIRRRRKPDRNARQPVRCPHGSRQ